ncbi:YbhN family protein [uncultured Corynebacterium sp.]|uniref:lysylphosphatidylglycerol synthase transmembrane domain-containing protein n=1 Tax=uncultured Corynebacterium sp. TaxID=159447 RepID=UPI0025E038DB|nr:YbhN family protein [uncultured Corynebacterium sp.]
MRDLLRRADVRAVLSLALIGLIAFLAREHLHFIGDGWRELEHADKRWIGVAVLALAVSMIAQAEVMVVLLRSAGVKVKRTSVNWLGLAANAWSSTFPGGPALSAAMIFREQMKWGATPVIASWYMLLSGALAGGGMAILAIGAVFFLGLTVKPMTLAMSLIALVALALLTNWVAKNPDKVERWLVNRLRTYNTRRGKPADRFTDNVHGFSQQLSAVELSLSKLAAAIVASLSNWIFEILCLLACIYAVGATPPIAGAVLAFLTAKLVGQAQVTPGGLGPVDVALTSALVGFGTLTSVQAFGAVIVFRMLSFVGLTLVGWIVFFATKMVNPKSAAEATAAEKGRPEEQKETVGPAQ